MTKQQRIAIENLEIWRHAADENRELRALGMGEIAKDLQATPLEDEQLQALIAALFEKSGARAPEDVFEKMAFCRAMMPAPKGAAVMQPPKKSTRVAMLSGKLFADAFAVFSPFIPEAKENYFSSLSELLEDTAGGAADFAILPLEDVKGVRFLHFFEEIDRLDLHITHTTDVTVDDTMQKTRFALLTKGERPTAPAHAERMLECHLSGEDARDLGELLSAATMAGLTLLRVDTRSSPNREETLVFYAAFLVGNGDAELFERYLSLFMPRGGVMAQYFHLK